LHAETPFELPDPLGGRGLRQPVRTRCGRDAAEADGVDEHLESDQVVES
jgi:hypothetical protein